MVSFPPVSIADVPLAVVPPEGAAPNVTEGAAV
jgi:hypothetical protein